MASRSLVSVSVVCVRLHACLVQRVEELVNLPAWAALRLTLNSHEPGDVATELYLFNLRSGGDRRGREGGEEGADEGGEGRR